MTPYMFTIFELQMGVLIPACHMYLQHHQICYVTIISETRGQNLSGPQQQSSSAHQLPPGARGGQQQQSGTPIATLVDVSVRYSMDSVEISAHNDATALLFPGIQ